MAYPTFYPFKTKYLQATSTTSNSIMSTVAPARAKLIGAWYTTTSLSAHTAVGVVDVTVNGSTATGMGALTVSTSTGASATNLGGPTAVTYLSAGDVLATVASSVVGGAVTFVVQEY